MTDRFMRDFEVDLLEEAEKAVLGDFESVHAMARIIVEDCIDAGHPEWIARRYGQQILDEYFAGLARHLKEDG
jgi:rRNA processing protein Krr1/Pno1